MRIPQYFQHPIQAKLYTGSEKKLERSKTGRTSSVENDGTLTAHASGQRKSSMYFCSFFICSLLNGKFVNVTSPLSRLNLETILISLDRGRFVVVHPRSTLPLRCLLAPSHNAVFKNTVKFEASDPVGTIPHTYQGEIWHAKFVPDRCGCRYRSSKESKFGQFGHVLFFVQHE